MLARFAGSRQTLSVGRRLFATQRPAVFIDENTRVICQGFTGKQVRGSWVLSLSLEGGFAAVY